MLLALVAVCKNDETEIQLESRTTIHLYNIQIPPVYMCIYIDIYKYFTYTDAHLNV